MKEYAVLTTGMDRAETVLNDWARVGWVLKGTSFDGMSRTIVFVLERDVP